jgi:hypothetical protein
MLYTDLANPTANSIYRQFGYASWETPSNSGSWACRVDTVDLHQDFVSLPTDIPFMTVTDSGRAGICVIL